MLKVALLSMPIASIGPPSLGLTQLCSVARSALGAAITVDVLYLHHDFANFIGLELSSYLANSVAAIDSGLGEWIFRRAAFPSVDDNENAYLNRYAYLFPPGAWHTYKPLILAKRCQIDAFLDDMIQRYRLDRYDIVGMTSMFAQNLSSFALARKLKKANSRIITVLGGANCEYPMGRVIAEQVRQLDYVFSGPGLVSFPAFLSNCLSGEYTKNEAINGIISRELVHRHRAPHSQLRIMSTSSVPDGWREIGEELDMSKSIEVDFSTFLLDFRQKFIGTRLMPILMFETSRGCWWGERAHCTFCGLNGQTMKFRAMSANSALAQFEQLFRTYPEITYFQAVDNIMPRNYVEELFPRLRTPDGITLYYEVKPDLSDSELGVLAKAGVHIVQPGIESLATSTLKLMRKGSTAFQNLQFLKSCVRHRIRPDWNLLIGFPGEPASVYEKYTRDLPRLAHLTPPSGAFPVRFDRFSPYFMRSSEYGLKLRPMDFYRLVYPFPADTLPDLAYFFADDHTESEYVVNTARWLRPLQAIVAEWRNKWRQAEPNDRPELQEVSASDGYKIFDSRAGTPRRYELTSARKALLDLLQVPRLVDQLRSAAAAIPGLSLSDELRWFTERGLVFEEESRLQTLVLPLQSASLPVQVSEATGVLSGTN